MDNRLKVYRFTDNVFKQTVVIITGKDVEVAKSYMKKHFDHDHDYSHLSDELGSTVWFGNINFAVVWLKQVFDLATLSHELLHVCIRRLESIGVKTDADNDETLAFYHSYWFRRVKKRLKL